MTTFRVEPIEVTIIIHFDRPSIKSEFRRWLDKERFGYWSPTDEPDKCIFHEKNAEKVEKWLLGHGAKRVT